MIRIIEYKEDHLIYRQYSEAINTKFKPIHKRISYDMIEQEFMFLRKVKTYYARIIARESSQSLRDFYFNMRHTSPCDIAMKTLYIMELNLRVERKIKNKERKLLNKKVNKIK